MIVTIVLNSGINTHNDFTKHI